VRLVDAAAPESHPNLVYAVPDEIPALLAELSADRIERVELHHLLGHAPEMLELPGRLRVPYEVHIHDYALLCPRVVLVGAAGRYCGEPDVAGCEACVAAAGSLLDEAIGVAALRLRSALMLAGACRVVVPSADAAARIARYFPGIAAEVVAHEDDAALSAVPLTPASAESCRVAVVGAISLAKGYDVLLACARDAAARALPLSFVVIGHTIDDARLLATGRAFITGPYAPGEAEALIRAQECTIALLPSVWPETWCYALTEAWRAGLRTVAFDLGAQAERVRDIGHGVLLPLDAPAGRINDVLLAGSRISRQKGRDTKKQEQVHDARCRPGRPPSIRRQARPARPRSEPRDGASGVRPPDDA
jgi:glycosyltransferase involved in cell wall biosynthesis